MMNGLSIRTRIWRSATCRYLAVRQYSRSSRHQWSLSSGFPSYLYRRASSSIITMDKWTIQPRNRNFTTEAPATITTSQMKGSESISSPSSSETSTPPPPPLETKDETTTPRRKNIIPTRHSIKQTPRICKNPVELQELTQQILETPIGKLFCHKQRSASTTTTNNIVNAEQRHVIDRDEAYTVTQETTQLVEYILRGYNYQFQDSLYCERKKEDTIMSLEQASETIAIMMDVLERYKKEGEMYMQLRHETYSFQNKDVTAVSSSSASATAAAASDDDDDDEDDDTSSSSSSSDSSSSSSDNDFDKNVTWDLNDIEDEEIEIGNSTFGEAQDLFSSVVQHKHEHEIEEAEVEELLMNEEIGNNLTKASPMTAVEAAVADTESYLIDFAPPGVTIAMYDTILDAIACATELLLTEGKGTGGTTSLHQFEPTHIYDIAQDALMLHEQNNRINKKDERKSVAVWFPYTIPTMVTYNATLRAISNLCLGNIGEISSVESIKEDQQRLIDQGLACGFSMYNHLTHNDHGLPKRNASSVIYLLRIIKACIPPSRTRGNITVTLWYQASQAGIVTSQLIDAIHDVHIESNGPEFDMLLEAIDNCLVKNDNNNNNNSINITPQRYARFAKKYQHSKFY